MTVTDSVRVGNGADLLSVLPYVIGFHPQESLVVMLMRGSRLAMTARFDLGAFDRPDDAIARFEQVRQRFSDCSVILVAYSDDLTSAHDCLALVETLSPADQLIDSIVCSGGRWWSRWCSGECCPPEGKPIVEASIPEVQAVAMGLSALPSRAAIEAQVCGPTAFEWSELVGIHDRVAVTVKAWSKRKRRERLVELVAGAVADEPRELGLEQTVELAQLATHIVCRDLAWLMIRPATAERHQAVWASVVKVTAGSAALPALSLLGAAGWIGGNGALLNCCLERGQELCEQLNVTYSMLDLLSSVSAGMVEPATWTTMMSDPEALAELKKTVGYEPGRAGDGVD